MSYMIYLTLNGKKQGLISAGCSTLDSIGNRYQKGHEDQIQVLSLDHSMTRDQNVSHHPIQFIKPIDKSSPLLSLAIDSNESLNGVFVFYRTNSAGQLELFYEVKITEATIVDISCVYPNSINSNDKMPYEKILLKYKSISWNHIIAGTSAYSIWDDRIY
ncbi:Hcp family type VI secretion system effector [Xenorhabdus bovienii]|uniref:Hcp family type VI secretion system effector n=2 Tax=Xenorhabdus bovienii TaxID=40576 RepID=UPI0023B33C2B|nr:Hcp family type VI secretion system effector [Xenorhabdus bovienii]MDE9495901.1 Hcp family type VI secretion system effector [Xenorhabdus bovienii]MDE9528017.1 Hcp family type VI secretion system effector [Xenorhabdus bovienii]